MERRSVRMLVSDDTPQFGDIFRDACRRIGWECDTVSNIADFRQRLGENAYNVVSIQMVNPGIDGLAALQALTGYRYPDAVLMFNHSTELYSRVAAHMANAFGFVIHNHLWPLTDGQIDKILRDLDRPF